MSPLCSRNARSQKNRRGAARRSFLLAERARYNGARSMRAVKDSLAVPPEGEVGKLGRPSPGLIARLGAPGLGGRSPAFLSILRAVLLLPEMCGPLNFHLATTVFPQTARLPVDSNSRMPNSQRLIASTPLRKTHPDSTRWKSSEIPSQTRSVSAFPLGGSPFLRQGRQGSIPAACRSQGRCETIRH